VAGPVWTGLLSPSIPPFAPPPPSLPSCRSGEVGARYELHGPRPSPVLSPIGSVGGVDSPPSRPPSTSPPISGATGWPVHLSRRPAYPPPPPLIILGACAPGAWVGGTRAVSPGPLPYGPPFLGERERPRRDESARGPPSETSPSR